MVSQEDYNKANKEISTITITRHEYEGLLDDQAFLDRLFAAGVDSWEGYEQAQEIVDA